VAKFRPSLTLEQADSWANGKLFTARQAHQKGLIDEIGSSTNAIDQLKKRAIIEEKIEWVTPEKEVGFLSYLTGKTDHEYAGASMKTALTQLTGFLLSLL
jgi:ClpP class serine protease